MRFQITLYSLMLFILYISQAHGADAACVSCHEGQVSQWHGSDHAKAMSIADSSSVLGDFSGVSVKHHSQEARFFSRDNLFFIDFTESGHTSRYEVQYTFGHFPLQQYLVPTTGGRLQVFPFAWDSRPKQEGGERWYPIYADEDIKNNDRLHWQQPLQNWNGMCADCHSDGLTRNYSVENNSFDTDWSNINVGCESCHGNMQGHNVNAVNPKEKPHANIELSWVRNLGEKIARLKNTKGEPASKKEKAQHGQFMDNCFSCHALRSPLTDGFIPNKPFLDQFSPTFLTPPTYHADGQIKEEAYVFGSFLQSKMYDAGVTCLNCHDAHSMKVKTETNGLCLQCHSTEQYQQERHTRHPLDSDAGQCVNCHMPETTYMGVDARRDHSFKIPRPDLADEYGLPQACSNCHKGESNQWAAKQLTDWHGKPARLSASESNYLQLMHKQQLPIGEHIALINDSTLPVIKRASAIMMLPYSTSSVSELQVKPWVGSDEALIRLATARVGQLLSEAERRLSYKNLLSDELKAVRVAAANHLVTSNLKDMTLLAQAVNELYQVNEINSWRAEGQFNQSLILLQQKRFSDAITALKKSIEVDPYFVPAYVNLAEIYRQLNQVENEKRMYITGLERNPSSAALYYAKGMFLIRSGAKPLSVQAFYQAMTLDRSNSQYAYLYFLALDATGETATAILKLRQVLASYDYAPDLVNMGLSFSQKLGDRDSFQYFMRHR